MSKRILMAMAALLGGCSTEPYFMELDDVSKSVNVKKYGAGKYFFHYSKCKFQSKGDLDGQASYFEMVENEINEQLSAERNCKAIKETLSYYDEGGYVSVLVKCSDTPYIIKWGGDK